MGGGRWGGGETLSLVPGGMTSLKNCLNFSALLALPCEGGKARATACWTASVLGAVAASFCRRSASKASIICKDPQLCTLSMHRSPGSAQSASRNSQAVQTQLAQTPG